MAFWSRVGTASMFNERTAGAADCASGAVAETTAIAGSDSSAIMAMTGIFTRASFAATRRCG